MDKLSRSEAVRLFREHWKWLAEDGTRRKYDWLLENGFGDEVESDCFCCEYDFQNTDECAGCSKCPIQWPETQNEGEGEPCMHSYYYDWFRSQTAEERKRLAKIISELPEADFRRDSV